MEQPMELRLADPHALMPDEVAAALAVDPAAGLDPADARRRADQAGPNALEETRAEPLWRMVVDAAIEPFVLLLFAAGVGAVLLGEVRDGLLVLAGLVPIVGAGVVTEYRGERALEALREASAPIARTRRAGAVFDVSAAELVPGDVVLLRAGDVVPADLRLVRAERLLLDRAILTGESIPEPGSIEPDGRGAPLTDRRAIAYAGTAVVGGRGEGLVVAIGRDTEFGRIAGGLASRERRRSPLQRELDRLVRILLLVATGLIIVVTGLGFYRGQELGANVLAGISAAIASIPEEPPVLLAVILGLGAYRLLRRGVLVRRLNAEEALGAVDLILTDKTGTLTQNRLEVASVGTPDGELEDGATRLAILADALRAEDDAWAHEAGVTPSSFTRTLARAVDALGGSSALPAADLLAAEPVSDVRPYSATRSRRDGRIEEHALGAPEAVLGLAAADGLPELDRSAWHELIERSATTGERLLGLASRRDGGRWVMRALIGFADPLRDGIRDAMASARRAGIQAVVVTGDHPVTAAAIARAAGLGTDHVVTGEELASWTDDRLAEELPRLHVVARSTPDQKERLVRVARRAGRMVVVTGDGVNDAPALHRADVAVAMGSGQAVAKEASDLVLGDDSFVTLMYGLAEGRRIVDNVQKGLVFLVSTHVALLGFLLIATIAGFGQPLLPIQILWLELFIDTSTSVAFEREPAEPDLMDRPPRPIGRPLLTRGLLTRISFAGGFSAVAALAVMLWHGGSPDHARWLAYTLLVCAQVVRAYANRSLRAPLHRLAPNGVLVAIGLSVIAIQALIPIAPALADAFRATPLDLADWALVALVALAPAVLAEAVRTSRRATWVA
jgi:Ca2+-transporting ATPase